MNINDRLAVLYTLEKFDYSAKKSDLISFLLNTNLFNRKKLELLFDSLIESNLIESEIRAHNEYFSILDEGKLVLNFFIGRLDNKIKETIDSVASETKIHNKNYKSHHRYDKIKNSLVLNISNDEKIIFSISINMSLEDYVEIADKLDDFTINDARKIIDFISAN